MAPGAMDQWTYGYMFRAVKETNKSRFDKLGVRNVPFGIVAEYVKYKVKCQTTKRKCKSYT